MSPRPTDYEVIVVGGGHAGTEAALASARMGRRTLLLTHNLDTVGQMSCNPSIGGIGKGHLVKEVDALGGAMAAAADEAGIHFRILNRSKGPAVRATRAQADRQLYRAAIRRRVEQQPNLSVFQAACDDLTLSGNRVTGVVTESGLEWRAAAVVLTAGTFLNGRIHVGLAQRTGGRAGDPASLALAARLKELRLPQGRLKTGTPPRLDGRTIDFSRLERQDGDGAGAPAESAEMPVFSFFGDPAQHPAQRPCWITHTNPATHDIVRNGLDRSPMFTGVIEGIGPRYCPSIEDKIHRFADKSSHQVFLEPEGLTTEEYYPNGISTSLPFDVQWAAVRSIAGLENAHIVRPGYAIEYDFFDPRALKRSFETRAIAGLFFAGQINGTTGYEEAAAQGLYAGINAALHARGVPAWTPARHEAYIGVLVDDLVSKGVTEPYRMFTSRAEFRLQLREDNADLRLTEIGRGLGLIGDDRWSRFLAKREAIAKAVDALQTAYLQPSPAASQEQLVAFGSSIEHEYSFSALLRRPAVTLDGLVAWLPPEVAELVSRETLASDVGEVTAGQIVDQIETSVKYAGYVAKQNEEVIKAAASSNVVIPDDLDYADVPALGFEVRAVLTHSRPRTLGDASRLSGITPASISLLLVHLHRSVRKERASSPA